MSIIFRNPGLADLRALTTMGVNVKPGSTNPIGYFGTGFKYAVATLLRHNCTVTLWRGFEPFRFTSTPVDIRDSQFSIVNMNDRELGFTTDLGKNWEPWQAYRELHCNALDEGGSTTPAHDDCAESFEGCENETWIVVSGEAIDKAHARRSDFLILDAPWIVTPTCEIRKQPAKHIFYRGFAAYALQVPSRYTWNITAGLCLSEDRTISYYSAMNHIAQGINALDDSHQALIEEILTAPRVPSSNACFEGAIDFGWSSIAGSPGAAFKSAVQSAARHHGGEINPTAKALFQRHWGDDFASVDTFIPNTIQAQQLASAVEFCTTLGFSVLDYPIILAERLGKHQYGQAHNGRIYVTRLAFEVGTKIVAGTLIEEFVHLREGFADESRALQDYLLNRVVSLGEQLRGRPL
jgi:hypothetical protein